MALAIAWIAFSATFSGIGLYFGSEMENSLVLFYGAPVAFTLVDCAWFFIIPHVPVAPFGPSRASALSTCSSACPSSFSSYPPSQVQF